MHRLKLEADVASKLRSPPQSPSCGFSSQIFRIGSLGAICAFTAVLTSWIFRNSSPVLLED